MVYLIDFENVHEEGFQLIGRLGDKDAVYCFFTRNVAKISMSALAGIRGGQIHFVEAESGKQSLDLALVSYLGYLIGIKPQELYYDIISNDNGFQKAADFWNKRGMNLRVRLRKTNSDTKTKREPSRSQQSQQQTKPAVSAVQIQSKQEIPAAFQPAAVQAEPLPENETPDQERPLNSEVKTLEPAETEAKADNDAMIAAVMEAAAVNRPIAEFLIAQTERYRGDRNKKQLVYRAVVKKYGQKNGTQIYNSVKKQLLK